MSEGTLGQPTSPPRTARRRAESESGDDAEPPDSRAAPPGLAARLAALAAPGPARDALAASARKRITAWRRLAAARLRRLGGIALEFRLWGVALGVGVLSGYAAVGFMVGLRFLLDLLYGAPPDGLAAAVADLPAWLVLITPALGGLAVGLLLHWGGCNGQPLGVADVIEARALRHARVDPKKGLISTLASLLSLGVGASAGREGPVVVAGATISSVVTRALNLTALDARTLLGCAVAAGVSASFNAPIAGALFALEVVLGHYAIRAFAPITIASVAGAVLSRTYLGDEPAFKIPVDAFGSYSQFPAFFLLGLLSAAVAVAMMASIFFAREVIDRARERAGLPTWSQPAFAGLALGGVAVFFPHVLSVGYQTTTDALAGQFDIMTCILFAVAKTAAVALTQGGRFAGGVFSPALMLGALTGSAFGAVATELLPTASGDQTLYSVAGMGAVAGAVLGAPISTTLIVFELTGDYAVAIAVMVSTSVATVATQRTVERSFFHWQLSKREIDLCAGPQTFLLPTLKVRDLMRPRGAENGASDTGAWELVEQGVELRGDDDLRRALPMFRSGALSYLPVVDQKTAGQGRTLIGALYYVDALRAYNRALIEVHEEEHS